MLWREFLPHIRHFSVADQRNIKEAFNLGMRVHEGQVRESGQAYFTHPVATATTVVQMGADPDTVIAALLHDTIEDTRLSMPEIESRFGKDVATMINGVTKLDEHDLADNPTLDEKIETLRKMFTLMEKDVRIMIIKLADRLHNMQTISFRLPEKQRIVAKETLDIYVKIADRLCMRDLRDELERLCHSVLEPELHALLMNLRSKNQKKCEDAMDAMSRRIRSAHAAWNVEVIHEPQSWGKIFLQYELQKESEGTTPQLNIVFRCADIPSCYQTVGIIHQLWPRVVMTFEDFINTPAVNGYKGIHTTVILEDGTHIRCKIRTHEMDIYARKGITAVCFGSKKAVGLPEYLPWTQHISPLSRDTQNRSNEFWETLQSDILSDSIVIYGNANKTALVPKGSTALDGALHLYPEDAIKLTAIRVNGRDVPLSRPLERADILEISSGDTKTVEREWLFWTHTGVGNAMIRSALSEEDRSVKITTGKSLLQEYLLLHHRGFITELDMEFLSRKLAERGLSNEMDTLYVQIAEGRLLPQEIERAIFRPQSKESNGAIWTLRLTADAIRWHSVYELLQKHQLKNVHAVYDDRNMLHVKASLLLTRDEEESLSQSLQLICDDEYHLGRRRTAAGHAFTSILLFLLWGIDPVLAHLLLRAEGLNPLNLTAIRFLSFAFLSGTLLFLIQRKRPLPETRLSLRNPSLWLSAFFLFLISITTYVALMGTLPSHYTIPMTAAGISITSIVNRRRRLVLAATWLLVVTGIWLLIAQTPGWSLWDIAFTAMAVLSFSGFSFVSERYKHKERVSLRIAQYLFLVSALCALLSIPLLGIAGFQNLSPTTIILSVLFSIFVTGAPYYIYYYLLSHREIDFILRYSFLIIPATLIPQAALIGLPTTWTILAALLVTLGAILPLRKEWKRNNDPPASDVPRGV